MAECRVHPTNAQQTGSISEVHEQGHSRQGVGLAAGVAPSRPVPPLAQLRGKARSLLKRSAKVASPEIRCRVKADECRARARAGEVELR